MYTVVILTTSTFHFTLSTIILTILVEKRVKIRLARLHFSIRKVRYLTYREVEGVQKNRKRQYMKSKKP